MVSRYSDPYPFSPLEEYVSKRQLRLFFLNISWFLCNIIFFNQMHIPLRERNCNTGGVKGFINVAIQLMHQLSLGFRLVGPAQ